MQPTNPKQSAAASFPSHPPQRALCQELSWFTWVQIGGSLLALLVGIAISATLYIIQTKQSVIDASDRFQSQSLSLANVARQSYLVPGLAFNQLVAGFNAAPVRRDGTAFREVGVNLLYYFPICADVQILRVLPHRDRAVWEARMSSLYHRNIFVHVPGSPGVPQPDATEYLVAETSSAQTDYLGAGVNWMLLPGISPILGRVRGNLASSNYLFRSPISGDLTLALMRPVVAADDVNVSVAVGNVTVSMDPSGMQRPGSALEPAPLPLSVLYRKNVTADTVYVLITPAHSYFDALQRGLQGLNSVVGAGTTDGTLYRHINGLLIEDVTTCAGLANTPDHPVTLLDPVKQVDTALLGCGDIVVGGLASPANSSALTFVSESTEVIARVRSSIDSVDGAVASFLIGAGGRVWLMTIASSTTYVNDVRAATWPIIVTGVAVSLVASCLLLLVLYLILLPRRRQTQAAREEMLQIKAAQTVQDQMVAFLSHEIRNPAHVIARSCEFLQELLPMTHRGRPDLDSIQESSEAIHRLINDVITFSAMRLDKLEVWEQLVELRPLVHRIVRNHAHFAQVPITFVVDARLPAFMVCDPMRIQQILANGLTNAAKFCTSGRIRVLVNWLPMGGADPWLVTAAHTDLEGDTAARILAGKVQFKVEDSGPGLMTGGEGTGTFTAFHTGTVARSVPNPQLVATPDSMHAPHSRLPIQDQQHTIGVSVRELHHSDTGTGVLLSRRNVPGSRALPYSTGSPLSSTDETTNLTGGGQPHSTTPQDVAITFQPRTFNGILSSASSPTLMGHMKRRPAHVVTLSSDAKSSNTPDDVTDHTHIQRIPESTKAFNHNYPFTAAQSARRGTGLGLPVAKMLCERLHGQLELYRDTLANVTVYVATLPLVPPQKIGPFLESARRMSAVAVEGGGASPTSIDYTEMADPSNWLTSPESTRRLLYQAGGLTSEDMPAPLTSMPFAHHTPRSGGSVGLSEHLTAGEVALISPYQDAESAGAESPSLPSGGSHTSNTSALGLHVLVADDERPNRLLLRRMLQRLGCTCTLVEEGDDAISELARTGQLLHASASDTASEGTGSSQTSHAYDCVLMDVYMKRTNGFECCREMRRMGCKIPIIAATGNVSADLSHVTAFSGVLQKPFTMVALRSALEACSSHKVTVAAPATGV